jgi:hypothetical protein
VKPAFIPANDIPFALPSQRPCCIMIAATVGALPAAAEDFPAHRRTYGHENRGENRTWLMNEPAGISRCSQRG